VAVPPGVVCQDEAGRLGDVQFLLALAARRGNGPEGRFDVHVRDDNRERTPPLARLKAVCGLGDGGAPVVASGCRREAAGRQGCPSSKRCVIFARRRSLSR
jgi:hypothetical protein